MTLEGLVATEFNSDQGRKAAFAQSILDSADGVFDDVVDVEAAERRRLADGSGVEISPAIGSLAPGASARLRLTYTAPATNDDDEAEEEGEEGGDTGSASVGEMRRAVAAADRRAAADDGGRATVARSMEAVDKANKPKKGLAVLQKIIDNFAEEINNFVQVCPKEMIDKLENPLTNKISIKEVS